MCTLEDQSLTLLAEAISLDDGDLSLGGDAWLQQRLGVEILANSIDHGPIAALSGANVPTFDPQKIGRRAGRRLESQVLEILCASEGATGYLDIPRNDLCSMIVAALTIGLGVQPGAACTSAALILRHLPETSLDRICALRAKPA